MTEPKLIPLEVLLGNPTKLQPLISPDGKRMGYMAPVDGVMNVWVGDVGADNYRPVTKDTDRGIQGYGWAHNNRHLIYIRDQGGDENWRLYSVDLETDEIRDLTPFEGVQARIEKTEKTRPDEILVGLNKDNPQLHDVYHLDLRTAELRKVAENPGFLGWVIDADLKVRGGAIPQPDGGVQVVVRDSEDGEWRPFVTFDSEDALASGPTGFTLDGKAMYLQSSQGANTARLVRKDIASGDEEVIAEDPNYDVAGVLQHPDTKEPQAVAYEKDRLEWTVLDPSIADDFKATQAIQDGDMNFGGRDHADRTWLLNFSVDDGPVSYYAFDRETKKATFLFDHRPELREYTLAKMDPFTIKARDGLELHGYIAFPPGKERKNLPMVLNVHGGPWYRDAWLFHPEVQWLANRGYLHVQVNFRGSTGYGKQFLNAANREWGAKMHDDLIDTVNWAVEQGYADRERVAIYGGSYGGFATLTGVTLTPDVFRCAVCLCGISDLRTWIRSFPPYWVPMLSMIKQRVGDIETEEDFLLSRSPISRVDNIKAPMLFAHGANDPRCKLAEMEQISEVMKENGIEHDLMVFENEGHGFVKPESRLEYYRAADKFLAKHLGGRSES